MLASYLANRLEAPDADVAIPDASQQRCAFDFRVGAGVRASLKFCFQTAELQQTKRGGGLVMAHEIIMRLGAVQLELL